MFVCWTPNDTDDTGAVANARLHIVCVNEAATASVLRVYDVCFGLTPNMDTLRASVKQNALKMNGACTASGVDGRELLTNNMLSLTPLQQLQLVRQQEANDLAVSDYLRQLCTVQQPAVTNVVQSLLAQLVQASQVPQLPLPTQPSVADLNVLIAQALRTAQHAQLQTANNNSTSTSAQATPAIYLPVAVTNASQVQIIDEFTTTPTLQLNDCTRIRVHLRRAHSANQRNVHTPHSTTTPLDLTYRATRVQRVKAVEQPMPRANCKPPEQNNDNATIEQMDTPASHHSPPRSPTDVATTVATTALTGILKPYVCQCGVRFSNESTLTGHRQYRVFIKSRPATACGDGEATSSPSTSINGDCKPLPPPAPQRPRNVNGYTIVRSGAVVTAQPARADTVQEALVVADTVDTTLSKSAHTDNTHKHRPPPDILCTQCHSTFASMIAYAEHECEQVWVPCDRLAISAVLQQNTPPKRQSPKKRRLVHRSEHEHDDDTRIDVTD
ncbi:unnamed protein product [Sphagnum balticum]